MARTYRRDSRGRFASGGSSGKAPKRIRYAVAYHGTSAEGAKGIKATGYRKSTGNGAHQGEGVYLSSRTTTPLMYPKSLRGTDRRQQRLIRHRISPKDAARLKVVSTVPMYRGMERTYLAPPDVANRSIVSTPTIRAQGRARAALWARRRRSA